MFVHVRRGALSSLALLAHVALSACAETEVRGRDVLRVAPLVVDERLVPAGVVGDAAPIEAGRDVADDDELVALARAASRAFVDELARESGREVTLTARLDACRLRAGPGRRHTHYLARCRASLAHGDVTLVVVEADAVRRVRSRAVTRDEAAEIARSVRNPLLDLDDSMATLDEAARAAARRLVDPRAASARELASETKALSRDEGRRLSLARLPRANRPEEIAAVLVDVARYGTPEDAAQVAPLVAHAHPLVRRAALHALRVLGDPSHAHLALERERDDDEDVRDEARDALLVLCAIEAARLYEPSDRSSKSSGAGAGDEGRIDDDAKKASTYRQNAACSKR